MLSRHPVLDHCRILDNRGGVRFDIGNEDDEVRRCLIERNLLVGKPSGTTS